MKTPILLTLTLLLLAACGQNPVPASLANTTWTLTSITHEGVTQTPPPGVTVTLAITADGKISGNSGCNQYTSNVVTQGNIIRLSSIQSTLRACADQKNNDFEGEYLARLFQGQTFARRDTQLTITFDDEKGSLTFTLAK